MYLTRYIKDHIEDLENGRTYMLINVPDYETDEPLITLYVHEWKDEPGVFRDLAHYDGALRFWDHLVSMLEFDATRPIDALDDNDPRNLKIYAEEAQQDYSKLHVVVAELGLGDEYCDFIVDTVVKALRKAYAKPTTAQAD